MTISTVINRKEYAGNGITTVFATPPFIQDADIKVKLVNDTTGASDGWMLATHYTLVGAGDAGGGTLTVSTSPTDYTPTYGETLIIYTDPALTQGLDLADNDALPAETVEETFDRLTLIAQRTRNLMERAVRLSDGDTTGIDMTLPAPVLPGKLLRTKSDITGLEYVTIEGSGEWSTLRTDMENHFQVSTLAALKALSVPSAFNTVICHSRSTIGDGYFGAFLWDNADLSASVASDTQNAIYVPPNSDATGGSGAWVRQYSGVLNAAWFGVLASGTASANTTALNAARDYVDTLGGGEIRLPKGVISISNFEFSSAKNIILSGSSDNYDYEGGGSKPTTLSVTTGTWGVRFNQTSRYCGLKNIRLNSNGILNETPPHEATADGVEYGVLIETFATQMSGVMVDGFQHGCVIANQGNSNIFNNCSFLWNTRTGFAALSGSTSAYAAYHPNIVAPGTLLSTTVYTMKNCIIRSNGWGMIIRAGQGHHTDCVIESNFFGGVMFYYGSLDTPPSPNFNNCYFENNWRLYDKDAVYTITQNSLLQETAGVWMSWTLNTDTTLNDAGYQINAASVNTGVSTGGILNTKFNNCIFHGGTGGVTQSKIMYLKSAYYIEFNNCSSADGDPAGPQRFSDTANNYHATAVIFFNWNGQSLPNPIGNKGASIIANNASGQNGGLLCNIGDGFQGLFGNVKFPATQVPSSDLNTLDDYEEGVFTATLTGVTTTVTDTAYYTKVGNTINIDLPTLTGISNATSKTLTGLPSGLIPARDKKIHVSTSNNNSLTTYTVSQGIVDTSGTIQLFTTPQGNTWDGTGDASLLAGSITYTVA